MRATVLAALFTLVACDGKVATDDGGGDDTVVDTDATNDADPSDDSDPGGGPRHHPDGFDDPGQHGLAAKMQDEACVACHGADLKGGVADVSCDGCHEAGWRTDCTFCHGEPSDGTGAPPLHISGQDDGVAASYVPHRAHTSETALHAAFDCAECHVEPEDVLSAGHLFVDDATPGVAEADFGAGLSDKAVWTPSTGQCSNLYCHGNRGQDNGKVVHTADVKTCHDCHPDKSTPVQWATRMSGEHGKHLLEGFDCAECHGSTVDTNTHVKDVTLHVNGAVDTSFASGMAFSGGRCTGSCHGENHGGRSWR